MADKKIVSRRAVLTGLAVGAGALALSSSADANCGTCGPSGKSGKKAKGSGHKGSGHETLHFHNADFYKGGKFNEDKAKDACIAVMKHHGYPIYPDMKENLWVSDYEIGQFMKVGLAARMWQNNEEDKYMQMDIFLMPGQMLPEHWHLATDKNPPKREGWLVRHGLSHIVGIGKPNLSKDVVIPKCHMGGKTETAHATIATPGVFVPLAKVLTKHWQFAGPEGAIITESANVHDNKGVRHSDPVANKYFIKLANS
jgi:D-lyxose ketol-isomerase